MTKALFGWNGPRESQETWAAFDPNDEQRFQKLAPISTYRNSDGERMVFWNFTEKLLGKHIVNIPQEIGDCVSWGMRNACDCLACFEIVKLGDGEEYKPSFPPYFYGISRVQIGGGRLGGSDGSLGIWAAKGVKEYGVLPTDDLTSSYNGQIAKKWGSSGPPADKISEGKKHLIQEFARVRSYDELKQALMNGYPATIASMRGFNMQLQFDPDTNKHWFTGRDSWPHQMAILGIDDNPKRPGVFRMNSWGDNAHGPQKDGPLGGGWQDANDIDKELRDNGTECIVYSAFNGFPAQSPNFYWC